MPAPLRGLAAAAVCAAACVGFAGCAINVAKIGDQSGTPKGKQAVAVVEKFAESSGADACDLLTPNALRDVYGGEQARGTPAAPIEGPPPAYALANCRNAAAHFEGQKVGIDKVTLIGDRAVKVQAKISQGKDLGDRLFTVTLRRKGNQYLIDEITEK
jgi:hypothetical protein